MRSNRVACQKNEPESNVSNLNMTLPYGRSDRRGQLSVIHYKELTEDLMLNDVARNLMAPGGLPPNELVAIYNLSAIENRDKISMPEFSVAMHIINRRINGHPVPNQSVRSLIALHKTMGNPIDWIHAAAARHVCSQYHARFMYHSLWPRKTNDKMQHNGHTVSGYVPA